MLNEIRVKVNQMCNTDYDPPELYEEVVVRSARKEHRCSECGRTIETGESYLYVFGVWQGSPNQYKVCRHCNVAKCWLVAECGGFLFEGIEEDIHGHAQEYGSTTSAALYRIVVGMRRKWRRRDGGMMPLPGLPAISAEQGKLDYR